MRLVIVIAAFIAGSQARPNAIGPFNVVTVPPNCPVGQEWINGQCREVWSIVFLDSNILGLFDSSVYARSIDNQNAIVVPPNCNPGQQLVNGVCRDVWRSGVGPQNVVTVPPNCPPGQVYVNGQCRDVWKNVKQSKLYNLLASNHNHLDTRFKRQSETFDETDLGKNIISVPNQCPQGYKPDALGYCREIF